MRAGIVTASVALLRLAFFNARRKRRKLLIELAAAAMLARTFGRTRRTFQKLTYLAAITALILKNRHRKTPVIDKQDMIQTKPQNVKSKANVLSQHLHKPL